MDVLKKVKMISVEPILFSYMMIIFMESNALQELFYVKSCIELNHPFNISDCSYELKQNSTTKEATRWLKYNSCCLSLFSFLSSLYVGSWSDRFGRKFPMLIPPIGTTCAAVINCFISIYIKSHVAYILLSSFISGITFGSVGIIATTFGYITDVTHEQSRSKRIVILESMLFIGGTVGIYIAGAFLKDVDYNRRFNNFALLFLFEALLSILIIFYISLRIPNGSYGNRTVQQNNIRLLNPKHVIDSVKTVLRKRENAKRKKLILMLFALFLIYFGSSVQTTLGYYFVKTLPNPWSFSKYSVFHSLQFIVEGIALLLGLTLVLHYISIPDHVFAALGLISRITGFVVFGLSINDSMIYSCVVLYMFSEWPLPALKSMLSKTVDADEKGRIFALNASLQNLSYLMGSFVLATIFENVAFKGLCFEITAGLQGVSLIIIIYLFHSRNENIADYETLTNERKQIQEVTDISSQVSNGDIINS